jgi:hypothetical protein
VSCLFSKIKMRDNRNKNSAAISGAKPGPGDLNVPVSNWIDLTAKKTLTKTQINTSTYILLTICATPKN